MTVRQLTAAGDIVTSGQHFIDKQQEIAQTVKTRLNLFLGEYFRDVTDGTDWFGKILGKGRGLQAAEAAIKNRISQTVGVLSIAEFNTDLDLASRRFSITCSITTQYGNAVINVESGI